MKEHQERQEALRLYLQGCKVSFIAASLRKSRKWVYHWIGRHEACEGLGDWYVEESRAPKRTRKRLADEVEAKILGVRKELEQELMAQTGAISIQYELARRGESPVPEVWTINRVLSRHGRTKKITGRKEPKEYPELYVHTHQMDLVGPRYIKGDGHYYSINLIDTLTRSCYVKAVRTKSSSEIVQAIAEFWGVHGFPDALQMDNELAFRGSNRHPRSFGSVVRFALSQGVAPVFIPLAEPWRNGIIEKFNSTYQRRFTRAHTFSNFEHLRQWEKDFIAFHNAHHRYSSLGQKTPDEMTTEYGIQSKYKGILHLPTWGKRPKIIIPLEGGSIFYIRYIRSDCKLYLPNEVFELHKELKYTYVVAEVNIDINTLVIRRYGQVVQVLPYVITAG